jgi:hypothetical protein
MSNLKNDNNKPIFYILTGAILAVLVVQFGLSSSDKWSEFILAGTLTPVLSAILIMFTNLIGHNIKHKLVFTRFKNEMPASRCHKLCEGDPRIDMATARNRWPNIFADTISNDDRNGYWYRDIYKGVRNRPEVLQAHGSFLLYRDAFSGLIGVFLVIVSWNLFAPLDIIGAINSWVYFVLGIFLLFTLVAARNSGNRFVVNAIASAL